jgi:hypothetical protein
LDNLMRMKFIFYPRISLVSLLCVVLSLSCISYGLTRWFVTSQIIREQTALMRRYIESNNIQILSAQQTKGDEIASTIRKPTSDILARIRHPGYPDNGRAVAVFMSTLGFLFLGMCFYFHNYRTSEQKVVINRIIRLILISGAAGLTVPDRRQLRALTSLRPISANTGC